MATKILTDIEIRSATSEDLPAIAQLIAPFVGEGMLLERTFDELEEWSDNFFVAVIKGRIVGCAALEIYSRKLAEIRSLAVAKDAQGMGIGKLLVHACVERAQQEDILEVMAITASEDFFVSCGFDFTTPNLKKAMFFQTRD